MRRAAAPSSPRIGAVNVRAPRAFAIVAAMLACAMPAGRAAAAGPESPLDTLVLTPAQVGSGYRLQQRDGGRGLQRPTLDFCGFRFASEGLRSGRLQVNYTRSATAPALSNEIVTYRSGKAPQALAEARAAIRQCPKKAVPNPSGSGAPVTFRVTTLPTKGLLPGSVAFFVVASTTVNGVRQSLTAIVIYQVRGDILSGIYAYPGRSTTAAALASFAFHAAQSSGRKLGVVA